MRRGLIILATVTAIAAHGRDVHAAESSLGVGLGYVKAKGVESTILYSGDFRFHLSRGFALAPEVSYWKKSATAQVVTASIKDLQFGVNALVVSHAGRDVELFVGGGGGIHSLTGDLAVGSVSAVSNSITKGGLEVLGGVDFKAGDALSFFLAARYDWVLGLSGEDPRRLDQAKFYGGFRLRF
jgi:opacity protein-like surface antigen